MTNRVFDIHVSQKVYLLGEGNAARRGEAATVMEGTVTKIARKYFYVACGHETIKFDRESFESHCQDENSHYILWPDEETLNRYLNARIAKNAIRGWLFKADPMDKNDEDIILAMAKLI